jgi:hypothetical protein
MAALSKAWTVVARSNSGVVSSNSARGMDVYVRLFCVCVVVCVGTGLATDWSRVQGVLPSVKKDYGTEEEARAQQKAVEP